MRILHIVFEDDEFKRLKEAKGVFTWHKFILSLTKKKVGGKSDETL